MNTTGSPGPSARHLRALSRVLALCCLVLIVALPVAMAIYWAQADTTELAARSGGAIQGELHAWQRLLAALISEVPLLLLGVGLWEAYQCFRQFSTGQVFTVRAVRSLRRFSAWIMASVAAGFVAGAAASVVLSWGNAPGARHLALSIGSDQVFTLFFAGMVWLMAAITSQGQQLAEENATFI